MPFWMKTFAGERTSNEAAGASGVPKADTRQRPLQGHEATGHSRKVAYEHGHAVFFNPGSANLNANESLVNTCRLLIEDSSSSMLGAR